MVEINLAADQLYSRLEQHPDKLYDLDKATVAVLVANRAIDAEGEYPLKKDFQYLKNQKVTLAKDEARLPELRKRAIISSIAGAILLGAGIAIAASLWGSPEFLIGLFSAISSGAFFAMPILYGNAVYERDNLRSNVEWGEKRFHQLCLNAGRIQVHDDYEARLKGILNEEKHIEAVRQILAFQNLFNNQGT